MPSRYNIKKSFNPNPIMLSPFNVHNIPKQAQDVFYNTYSNTLNTISKNLDGKMAGMYGRWADADAYMNAEYEAKKFMEKEAKKIKREQTKC